MVSSFRALSFASRVLDEKKKNDKGERGKRGESAKGEKRSLSLSFSISERRKPREL